MEERRMKRSLTAMVTITTLVCAHQARAQEPEEWYRPTGTTCSTTDVSAAKAVKVKADLYNASTMISPDSAKLIALCAVPGQIGSAEMKTANGRTEYAVDIIPNKKK